MSCGQPRVISRTARPSQHGGRHVALGRPGAGRRQQPPPRSLSTVLRPGSQMPKIALAFVQARGQRLAVGPRMRARKRRPQTSQTAPPSIGTYAERAQADADLSTAATSDAGAARACMVMKAMHPPANKILFGKAAVHSRPSRGTNAIAAAHSRRIAVGRLRHDDAAGTIVTGVTQVGFGAPLLLGGVGGLVGDGVAYALTTGPASVAGAPASKLTLGYLGGAAVAVAFGVTGTVLLLNGQGNLDEGLAGLRDPDAQAARLRREAEQEAVRRPHPRRAPRGRSTTTSRPARSAGQSGAVTRASSLTGILTEYPQPPATLRGARGPTMPLSPSSRAPRNPR